MLRGRYFDFSGLHLKSGQYKKGRDRNARMRDHAKSTVRVRIRGQAVGVNSLHCCEERNQQQTDDSENLVSEVPGARLGSELEHQILNTEVKN